MTATINHPPALGFRAYSKTGKTTLIKKLIPCLLEQHVQVGVLKHTHHDIDFDKPGKDSYEIHHAGSQQTIIATSNAWAMTCRTSSPPSTEQLLQQFDPERCQLIIIEGYKGEAYPNLLLSRHGAPKETLSLINDKTLAIVSDHPVSSSLPVLDINNPKQVAQFIIRQYLSS